MFSPSQISELSNKTLVLGGIGIFIFIYLWKSRRPKNFPPGPRGLPVVGYATRVSGNVAEDFRKMKEKYGPVMRVQMGTEDWVVLNNYESIHEALVKQGEKFSGRPSNVLFDILEVNGGLAMADYGPEWKSQRKFGLMTLRGFGVGKKSMEENINEEVPYLIDNLTKDDDVSFQRKMSQAVSNIICRVVFGQRYEYGDERLEIILDVFSETMQDTPDNRLLGMLTVSPSLRFLPYFRGALQRTTDKVEKYLDNFKELVLEQVENFDENEVTNVIDAYLVEMSKGTYGQTFDEKHLIMFVKDLFEAGTATTASTLNWAILIFLNYPEILEKVVEEVDSVLDNSGVPSMEHRKDMPYTCAFIQELMRHRLLAPTAVFHKTNATALLYGYTIPKNTTIIPNIWAVHFDPDLFKDPKEFRPERFIDESGKFIKSSHVIPFSIGPRHCVGEQLARMEIFIFLVVLVQKFKIVPVVDSPLPSIDDAVYNFFSTLEPKPFQVRFEPR